MSLKFLAAAALRCLGGKIYTKLIYDNDEQFKRAKKMGIDFLYQGQKHIGKLNAAKEICKTNNMPVACRIKKIVQV